MSNADMPPPWLKYPELPHGSIGWRMGFGEEYYNAFYKWFSALKAADRMQFRQSMPEPSEWSGFYQMIADSPWLET